MSPPGKEQREFRRIPSVSLRQGKVVVTSKGGYVELRPGDGMLGDLELGETEPSKKWGHTLAIFEALFTRFPTAYVIDVDGITRSSPQLDLVRKIAARGDVWVDSGVWVAESGMDLLMVGARGMVMATKSMRSFRELEEATELFEEVIVSIDYDGRILARGDDIAEMGPGRFAKEAAKLGVTKFVLADLRRKGADETLVGKLLKHCPELYVGGGVKGEHCGRLEELGAAGAVLELSDVVTCMLDEQVAGAAGGAGAPDDSDDLADGDGEDPERDGDGVHRLVDRFSGEDG